MFRFRRTAPKPRASVNLLLQNLESRLCPAPVAIHQVVATASSSPITLAGVLKGDQIVIRAKLTTSDPGEAAETDEAEYLHIQTPGGEFVDRQYGVTQVYRFTATADNQRIAAYVHDYDGDETATLDIATTSLKIAIPNGQTVFHIGSAPKMPDITARASFANSPASLAGVTVTWEARVWFPQSDGPNAIRDIPTVVFTKKSAGPDVTFSGTDWRVILGGDLIRGGRLTLTATATVGGKTVEGVLDGLKILGDNPSANEVKAYINSLPTPANYPANAGLTYQQVMLKIAYQESLGRLIQFRADGTPLFNIPATGKKPDGGAGLMQITPPSDEQVWDWKASIDAGAAKFNDNFRIVAKYQTNLNTYVKGTLLPALNVQRAKQHLPPITTIVVPPFTPTMTVYDAIRGYNGWNGSDPVNHNFVLHEYALARSADGSVHWDVNEGTLTATATWVRVPASARTGNGDHDYVNKVLARPSM